MRNCVDAKIFQNMHDFIGVILLMYVICIELNRTHSVDIDNISEYFHLQLMPK